MIQCKKQTAENSNGFLLKPGLTACPPLEEVRKEDPEKDISSQKSVNNK